VTVLTGSRLTLAITAVTVLESMPPLRKEPRGTSLLSLTFTASEISE